MKNVMWMLVVSSFLSVGLAKADEQTVIKKKGRVILEQTTQRTGQEQGHYRVPKLQLTPAEGQVIIRVATAIGDKNGESKVDAKDVTTFLSLKERLDREDLKLNGFSEKSESKIKYQVDERGGAYIFSSSTIDTQGKTEKDGSDSKKDTKTTTFSIGVGVAF